MAKPMMTPQDHIAKAEEYLSEYEKEASGDTFGFEPELVQMHLKLAEVKLMIQTRSTSQ